MTALLQVENLRVHLPVEGRPRPVLHEVTFAVAAGEALGLVGESGSGKSMTARAIGRLLPGAARVEGAIRFDGADVLGVSGDALRRYRSGGVSMIFQDPRAHINPVRTVGDFLTEGMRTHQRLSRADATRRAVELLADVGIDDGTQRMAQFPHELSGGLLQRVMIAAALAAEPRMLLADEPTTALDVTTQSEVMAILDRMRRERGMAMVFITHDLELAAAVCDRTAVMYAGSIVEQNTSAQLHSHPLHPYTQGLLQARPDIASTARLVAIPGQPLSAYEVGDGCPFRARCRYRTDVCDTSVPPLRPWHGGSTRCLRIAEVFDQLIVPDRQPRSPGVEEATRG
jgi:oligopeptide/dipeptide ABC transporter ATP-binding protein